jgi:hypothetical protein
MRKLKSCLVTSISIIALALLAFAAPQAYAEDLDAVSGVPQTIAEIATAEAPLQTTDEAERIVSGFSAIELAVDDAGTPSAVYHLVDAIKVEITQSVTIALAGEAVDEDVTGSIPELAATEPEFVVEAQTTKSDEN